MTKNVIKNVEPNKFSIETSNNSFKKCSSKINGNDAVFSAKGSFFRKITLFVAIFSFIAMSSDNGFAADARTAEFKVDGEWRKGTLHAPAINDLHDGPRGEKYVEAVGTWALESMDGSTIAYGEIGLTIEWRPSRGGGAEPHWARSKSKVKVSSDVLEIESTQQVDIAIYDYTGRCVYSATNQTNVAVDRSLIPNGNYIIHLVNQEGEVEVITFLFVNDSFYIRK